MRLEEFKSAWLKRSEEEQSLSSARQVSQSVQFARTSVIRDLQRSEDLARSVFCLLFATLAIGASLKVMSPGAGRIAAWLFGAALMVDAITGMALLARRFGASAAATMLEFVSREYRQAEIRIRLERYSQRLVMILAGVALLLLLFAPRPINLRDNALDALERMAIVTAFLAFAWRTAKSRSGEICRELERCLKDLER